MNKQFGIKHRGQGTCERYPVPFLFVKIFVVVILSTAPSMAFADVVWPALIAETKVTSVPVIALSLLIEFWFFRWLFKVDSKRAAIYTFSANLVSGLIGFIARPLSGIAYELSLGMVVNYLFDWGTFNPVAWFFVPFVGGAVNALIELGFIKKVWDENFTLKQYVLTVLINALTIAIATTWVLIYPPRL